MVKQPSLEIVIGAMNNQQNSVIETVPHLLPAALYADKVLVVTPEDDTLIELPDYFDVFDRLGYKGEGVIDYIGIDNPSFDWNTTTGTNRDNHFASRKKGESWEKYLEREAAYEAQKILEIVNSELSRPEVMPLIYDPNARLAKNALDLGRIAMSTKVDRRAAATLGTELILKLPSFQSLSPDEIVELRNRLSDNLIPFRAFVNETSAGLIDAGDDQEQLADIIHDIYVQKVIPVLGELEKQTKDNRFLKRLVSDFGRDPKTFFQSFITFGIGEAVTLPPYVSIGAAVSTQLIAEAAKLRSEGRVISSNRLHFLYQIEHPKTYKKKR